MANFCCVGCVLLGRQAQDQGLDLSCLDGVGKILNKAGLALNSPVGQLADLLRVEALPRASIQVVIQGQHPNGVAQVNEGVAHIAIVLQVNWQIQKVVVATMPTLIQSLQKHLLRVLVRYVLDHHCCARVYS